MKARVTVTLKSRVLDPQGEAIAGALKSLAFTGIHSIRQGKVFDIVLDDQSAENANYVLENYTIELL
ncbi:phosphoribosylformylglycinamidine synthase subunit PurS [Bartonella sp. MR168JLCBS]|uniref:phosphoribosylformylglycinamidine synthase subunit PurS n=1 Tax=Bartonella sp. MR168JLCBS TaxID=3243556 RepID=UPI0035CF3E21